MIVIVDTELTCDEPSLPKNEMEVIEIGAVKFNLSTLEIVDEFQAFVKPKWNHNLTDYCKKLTGITQEQINSAHNFESEYNRFMKWFGSPKKNQFASWGDDLQAIGYSCAANDFECKYLTNWDLKRFYQEFNGTKGLGLDKAMKQYDLKFIGSRHRALDDAKNTALLLKEILKK